jgi:hypothetical protein
MLSRTSLRVFTFFFFLGIEFVAMHFRYRDLSEFGEFANLWSTGRESNPRMLVLQTNALATSPPVPIQVTPQIKNPPRRLAGGSSGFRDCF